MLRDEFKEGLRALGEFLSPNQTSWTCFFILLLAKPAPAGPGSARSGSREHFQLHRCAGHHWGRFYPVLGVCPSTNSIIFMLEKPSVTAGTCSGVCGAESESSELLGCFLFIYSFLDLVEFVQFGHWEITVILHQQENLCIHSDYTLKREFESNLILRL